MATLSAIKMNIIGGMLMLAASMNSALFSLKNMANGMPMAN